MDTLSKLIGTDTILDIDDKTLEDLDILPGKRAFCLLNLLNERTKSTDAREMLKNFIISPNRNLQTIYGKQSEITFIIQNFDSLSKIQINDPIIYACRDYLNSNIVTLKSQNKLSVFTNSFGYHKFIPVLRKGIGNFRLLFHQIKHVLTIDHTKTPRGLKELISNIMIFHEKIINSGMNSHMGNENPSDYEILIIDSVLRGNLLEETIKLLSAFISLDAYIAIGKFSIDFDLRFPEFKEGIFPTVQIQNLRNLAIKNYKCNNVRLGDKCNLLYLTGPNMSGKSSFLKAFGCAVFLAHLGMGVPATSMSLTVFDGIISDINNEDSISEGQSYFLSEVLRIKAITQQVVSSKKILVICDELFRGTNVIDARDCTRIVIEGFNSRKNSIFLIASHIYDIKNDIKKDNSIGWFNFESSIMNGKPVYSYILKEGISDQRNGLLILKNEGILDLFSNIVL